MIFTHSWKGRRDVFLQFPRALTRSETLTASSRIWTLIVDYIFYNDNGYVKRVPTSCNHCILPRLGQFSFYFKKKSHLGPCTVRCFSSICCIFESRNLTEGGILCPSNKRQAQCLSFWVKLASPMSPERPSARLPHLLNPWPSSKLDKFLPIVPFF